ncbi:hypothetical protein TCAL_02579 [Tigriopus californicus]|uniref:RAP domain-containing protein n=1 Tax=Tigriopus californicus TaxID=6832 RepID=A0A553P819_TIGCA|nr:hypothetical protein TCAL_02579 [Tigriopus californicus]
MWWCRSAQLSALPLRLARRTWASTIRDHWAPGASCATVNQLRPIWLSSPGHRAHEASAPTSADPPHMQQRQFSKVTDSRLIEHYLEDVFGEEDPMEHMRNIMHPESRDQVVFGLCQAQSLAQVFEHLADVKDISLSQAEQALASLFHLQKFTAEKVNYLPSPKFGPQVLGHPTFERILQVIERNMAQQTLSHGAYTFLALLRLEVPMGREMMMRLQIHLQRHISTMDLDALAYFCVALRGRNSLETRVREASLSWHMALAPTLPYLEKFVESAENAEDIRKIAICVNALSRVVSNEFMDRFCRRIKALLAQGEFAGDEALSSLVKVLSISLAKRDWHFSNFHFVREIILQLTGRIHTLSPVQLLVVNRLVSKNKDPVSIHYELADVLTKMYEELKAKPQSDFVFEMELVRALATLDVFIWPPNYLSQSIKKAVSHPQSQMVMSCVFDILRCAGLFHESVSKAVLTRALEACKNNPPDFHRLIVRYYDLANNMSHKIRDVDFEQKAVALIRETIMTCPFPGRFSSHLSFIIAYDGEVSEPLLQRFLQMVPNMNAFCILLISRSLETRTKQTSARTYQNFQTIQLALSKRAQDLLAVDQTSPEKFILLKSQYSRQKASDSAYDVNVRGQVQLVSPTDLDLNAVTVRRISQSMKNLFFTMDIDRPNDFIEKAIKYVITHQEHLHNYVTNVVLGFLFTANYDGHIPNEFFDVCSKALVRDMNYESAITILQVILNSPEYKVPWLEDDLTPVDVASRNWVMLYTANMRQEVQLILGEILGGREYFQEHLFTPYYSFIDFEVVMNAEGKPVKKEKGSPMRALTVLNRSEINQETDLEKQWTRYAILIMAPQAYAFSKEVLKGFLALTVRNIGKEGFKVICINPFQWHGMHMVNKTGKAEFLKEQLGMKR